GGRAIYPVNVRLGGFYRAPARAELTALTEPLRRALDMLALIRPGTYAIEEGTMATRSGLFFAPAGFDQHVIEDHVPHSTALHARLAGGGRYLTGPLARYALSAQWLSPLAPGAPRAAGLGGAGANPVRSTIGRAGG